MSRRVPTQNLATSAARVRPRRDAWASQAAWVRAIVIGTEGEDPVYDAADAMPATSVRCGIVDIHVPTAIANGIAWAEHEASHGTDLLVVAVPGDDTKALALIALLSGVTPSVLAAPARVGAVEAYLPGIAAYADDPQRAIEELHQPATGHAAGFLLEAAARGVPVLLDGVGALAAALAAAAVAPDAAGWWQLADTSNAPAVALVAERLGLHSVLSTGGATGDGVAGLHAADALRGRTPDRVPA